MGYRLTAQNGDILPVPQLVVANLPRADGDSVRVALYILATNCTDAKTIAHKLGLRSEAAAERAMLWWEGVGLLEKECKSVPGAAAETSASLPSADELDLSAIQDPYVSVLCEEAQTAFGKAIGRHDLQRLVALYLTEGWQPDVILLCCAEMARQGRRTVGAVTRELLRWREDGVETGEDAERFLKREAQREEWQKETAALFDVDFPNLTAWEKRAVVRWHEEWQDASDMIEEALLHADRHRTVRYVDGILRSWHAQGLTSVAAVRGKGSLSGTNIAAVSAKGKAKPMKDMFHRDWNAVFDDDTEG
jgi:DnaD/phage-associated family protein